MAPELSKIFLRLVIGYYSPIFRANYKDIPLDSIRRPIIKPEDWKADWIVLIVLAFLTSLRQRASNDIS